MMNIEKIMKKIFEKENISIEESEFLFRNILTGQLNEPEISNILLALKLKGETPDEQPARSPSPPFSGFRRRGDDQTRR